MKEIARLLGGSHLYKLNTPQSDLDERYIYLNTDTANIVGLEKNTHIEHRDPTTDSFGFELRAYLASLRKTNTVAMEFLFAPSEAFSILTPEFEMVRANAKNLVNPEVYYKSLLGYLQAELKLATGARTGKLGSKRKTQLDKFGFSPKNFVQLLRLAACGIEFYSTGNYPVDIMAYDEELGMLLLDIKTHPEKYDVQWLIKRVFAMEDLLKKTYTESLKTPSAYHYDPDIANHIILQSYFPILKNLLNENYTV